MIKAYIPTFDRELSQITYDHLPKFMKSSVIFVVQPEERAFFKKHYSNVLVLPFDNIGIAKTRQFIMEQAGPVPYFVFDDDLKFYKRAKYNGQEGDVLLDEDDWKDLIINALNYLEQFTYGGFATLGSFPVKKDGRYINETYNTGVFTAYFFDGKKLKGVKWDSNYDFLEDVDFIFQLLSKGHKSVRLNDIAWKQKPRAPGGCESGGRTAELQQHVWRLLYEKWGSFMRITKTTRKSAYHTNDTRYTCLWKKAYKWSQASTLFI